MTLPTKEPASPAKPASPLHRPAAPKALRGEQGGRAEQKKKITIYVSLLTLVILVAWFYFFKAEINRSLKQSDDSFLGDLADKFSNMLYQSNQAIDQAKNNYDVLSDQVATVTPAMAEDLAEGAAELLWQKRTADWNIWENDLIGFKHPNNWEVIQSENFLLVRDMPNAYKPYTIQINFFDNPEQLSASDWWADLRKEAQEPDYTTLSEELKFGDRTALSKTIDNHQDLPDQYSRLIFVPAGEKMIQILMATYLKEYSQHKEFFNDFIKTISIKETL